MPIVFGLIITFDCISSFCGLAHDVGPTYGQAMYMGTSAADSA